MTSPCHPGSSSPYSPLSPSRDPEPSTSSAASCSYTLSSGEASTSSSQAVDSAAKSCLKRSRSENTSESSEPKKKKSKTKHCDEPSSKVQRSSLKRKADDQQPTSKKRQSKTGLPRSATWRLACRYTSADFHPLRRRINAKFLTHLQRELQTAQKSLEQPDLLLGQALQEVCTAASGVPSPIVLFKRTNNQSCSRLGWDKLVKALSRLETQARNTSGPLGKELAERAARWLAHLFKFLNPRSQVKTLISGMSFTRLCAQALSAQGVSLTEENPIRPMQGGDGSCFLSREDFEQARREDPDLQLLDQEYAVCFLRFSHSGDGETPGVGYPTVDFDAPAHQE